jgi:phosphoribosylanthranilate isomerase
LKTPFQIKICGICAEADLEQALGAGADAVGFVFAPGPRQVTASLRRSLGRDVSRGALRVGVFADEAPDRVRDLRRAWSLDLVQLHGRESPAYCHRLGLPFVKALAVRGDCLPDGLCRYGPGPVLLDAPRTGGAAPRPAVCWKAASSAARRVPVILAGGLTPGDVSRAIREVRPVAVDVSSGVERAPGHKDPQRMRLFVERARRALRTEREGAR